MLLGGFIPARRWQLQIQVRHVAIVVGALLMNRRIRVRAWLLGTVAPSGEHRAQRAEARVEVGLKRLVRWKVMPEHVCEGRHAGAYYTNVHFCNTRWRSVECCREDCEYLRRDEDGNDGPCFVFALIKLDPVVEAEQGSQASSEYLR